MSVRRITEAVVTFVITQKVLTAVHVDLDMPKKAPKAAKVRIC